MEHHTRIVATFPEDNRTFGEYIADLSARGQSRPSRPEATPIELPQPTPDTSPLGEYVTRLLRGRTVSNFILHSVDPGQPQQTKPEMIESQFLKNLPEEPPVEVQPLQTPPVQQPNT